MSLELINVGVEPNDGTGDPPRPAALKINANFQAIDQAFTALNTSDAAQDSAIAALILNDGAQDTLITGLTNDAVGLSGEIAILAAQLDARDTANRDRANHTGTQPAATVEGLATVATSGAYDDLSGNPTLPYGFTYDQQAEPVGPAAGATWRERSAGGLIVGDWEWDASLAEWTDIRTTYIYHSQDVSIAAGAAGDRYRNSSPLIFIPDIKRIVLYGWALSVVTPTAMNPGGIGGEGDSSTNYRGFLPTTVNSNNAGFAFSSFAVSTQGLTSAAGASAILTASGKELRTLNEGLNEALFRGLGFISTAVNGGIVGTPPVFNNCRATYKIKFVRG